MQYYTHKQHGGVLEARDNGDGTLGVSTQGGGLVRRVTQEQLQTEYDRVRPDFSYKEGTVTADFLDSAVIVPCFTDGKRWNGWGMPSFTLDIGKSLIPHLPELRYDEEKDAFIWSPHDGEEEMYEPVAILVNREPIKVYPIGTGSWTWDSVSLPSDTTS